MVCIVDVEQNLIKADEVVLVVILSPRSASWGPWCENMASSAKPELANEMQRRQRRTGPPLKATCTEIWRSSAMWFLSYAREVTSSNVQTLKEVVIHFNRHLKGHVLFNVGLYRARQ